MSSTIIGLIVIIAAQFVPVEEVNQVLEAIGIIISWIGRFRLGDITPLGFRK